MSLKLKDLGDSVVTMVTGGKKGVENEAKIP
jgi:hypothetical protein